jgi:hypothetical protein
MSFRTRLLPRHWISASSGYVVDVVFHPVSVRADWPAERFMMTCFTGQCPKDDLESVGMIRKFMGAGAWYHSYLNGGM